MVGSFIGPYRILRLLGEGGMAAVYEGFNDAIERHVAIKVLHAEAASRPEIVTRFFNEALAVNRIDHPSIVQIHEHGFMPDGKAYLVMEFIKGETLFARLVKDNGRLSPKVALQIAWQVAEAITRAHSRNIVHRDLKPENLMLIHDPLVPGGERVKVLDFGIARFVADSGQQRTANNVVMGTPTYMSPEQCQGSGSVDDRTDVYSLGVILYQMLAGRPPFMAVHAWEIMNMHLRHAPPSMMDVAPEVPKTIAEFVELLLSKDKGRRPSMSEVALRLPELAASAAIASQSPVVQQATILLVPGQLIRPPVAARTEQLPKDDGLQQRGRHLAVPRRKRGLWIVALLVGAAIVSGGLLLMASLSHNKPQAVDDTRPASSASLSPANPALSGSPQKAAIGLIDMAQPDDAQKTATAVIPPHPAGLADPSKTPLHKRRPEASVSLPSLLPPLSVLNPPRPTPELSPDEVLAILSKAEAAYANGDYPHAIEFARSVQHNSPARAWRIIGASACTIKDAKLAGEAFRHLDPPSRQFLTYSCRLRNIVLPDGEPN